MKLNSSLSLTFLALSLGSVSATTYAQDFIEPPMASIPAGDFLMGSDRGRDDEKPVRNVSVSAFQMAKYEVTVAEFRKFVETTGYTVKEDCNHRIGQRWFGTGPNDGSWENNIYATNEFYPVVCVSRTDAVNYAKWLSEETGKHYRLPTEAEWEYVNRSGTNTRFFFGDEPLSAKACEYANLSDYHAFARTEEDYGAPYNSGYTIQPCNDGEVLLSVVGLYKPNPFGVHDMLGNVMERLADCYQESYEGAPTDGSAVTKAECEQYVVRGGSWHWEAFTSSQRNRMGDDLLAALEGFRLVLDTDGKALDAQPGTTSFVTKLTKAQKAAKKKHKKIKPYPRKPEGLEVVSANKNEVSLRWYTNPETHVTGYRVYRQDPQTNETIVVADKLKAPVFIDNKPLKVNARYHVVALNGTQSSLPGEPVDSGLVVSNAVPGKLQGESFFHAEEASVYNSGFEPDGDKVITRIADQSASYVIDVAKSGDFTIDARVFDSGSPETFELWLGDKLIASPSLVGERGWTTVENIAVTLQKGKHAFSIKGNTRNFTINWLTFKSV